MQPCEAVVVHTADLVVPEHPGEEANGTLRHKTLKYYLEFQKHQHACDCCPFLHHSQHTQSLKATEHPASHRVYLIGREVKLDDGRRTFKRPIFNLGDFIVAEVTV